MIWIEVSLAHWRTFVGKQIIKRRLLGGWDWTPFVIVRTRKPYRSVRVSP